MSRDINEPSAEFFRVFCACGKATVMRAGARDECDYCDRPMRAPKAAHVAQHSPEGRGEGK